MGFFPVSVEMHSCSYGINGATRSYEHKTSQLSTDGRVTFRIIMKTLQNVLFSPKEMKSEMKFSISAQNMCDTMVKGACSETQMQLVEVVCPRSHTYLHVSVKPKARNVKPNISSFWSREDDGQYDTGFRHSSMSLNGQFQKGKWEF